MLILFLTETYEINISHVRMLKTTTATRPRTFATESVDCSRLQTRRISEFPYKTTVAWYQRQVYWTFIVHLLYTVV